jgi:hypothetical protein
MAGRRHRVQYRAHVKPPVDNLLGGQDWRASSRYARPQGHTRRCELTPQGARHDRHDRGIRAAILSRPLFRLDRARHHAAHRGGRRRDPAYASAAALLFVACMMTRGLAEISRDDITEYAPAVVTAIAMR